MHPTLVTIGKLTIHTYTVLLAAGLVLGLAITYLEGKRKLGDGLLALDMGLLAIVGGILGGRIAYVAANWNVFREDWLQMLRLWEGGYSFHGAFLGGLLAVFIFAEFHRDGKTTTFWNLADVLTPGLALGITFGWLACLMAGCAYGSLGQGLGYVILPDIYGIEAPRFATQAIAAALSFLLFIVTWLLRDRWPFAGAVFLCYTLLYFTGQYFLEFTRGDEAILIGSWRLSQAFDLILALASASLLMILWWNTRRERQPDKRD
jgi:phosphatidylglycerol:prolipoprotein diacylglycerol transferase